MWEGAIVINELYLTQNNLSKRATKGQTHVTVCWVQTVRIVEIFFYKTIIFFYKTIIRPTIHCKFPHSIQESLDVICPFSEENTTIRKTSLRESCRQF